MRFLRQHSWLVFVVAYIAAGQVVGMLWPWRGWSLHAAGLVLLVGFIWGVGRFDGTLRPRRQAKRDAK